MHVCHYTFLSCPYWCPVSCMLVRFPDLRAASPLLVVSVAAEAFYPRKQIYQCLLLFPWTPNTFQKVLANVTGSMSPVFPFRNRGLWSNLNGFLCWVKGKNPVSFFYMCLPSCLSTSWRRLSLLTCVTLHLCPRLTNHSRMGMLPSPLS